MQQLYCKHVYKVRAFVRGFSFGRLVCTFSHSLCTGWTAGSNDTNIRMKVKQMDCFAVHKCVLSVYTSMIRCNIAEQKHINALKRCRVYVPHLIRVSKIYVVDSVFFLLIFVFLLKISV